VGAFSILQHRFEELILGIPEAFLRQLAKRDTLNLRRQPVVRPPLPQPLCLPAGEAGNH